EALRQMPSLLGAAAYRNAMPSLHAGLAYLLVLTVWPLSRGVRIAAILFLIGTLLATLGLGQHYLIDLVVAVPLALAVYAVAATAIPIANPVRRNAIVAGFATMALWIGFMLYGLAIFDRWPPLVWLASI